MGLTLKEKAIAKEYVHGEKPGNGTEAALKTYNVKNRKSAKSVGNIILNKPHVRREVERLLEEHDLTDDFAMQTLKEGLKATHVANYKGEAIQTDIPDHAVRHKYFQDLAKFKELYPADKLETKNINIDIQLEGMTKEEIKELLKETLKSYEGNQRSN